SLHQGIKVICLIGTVDFDPGTVNCPWPRVWHAFPCLATSKSTTARLERAWRGRSCSGGCKKWSHGWTVKKPIEKSREHFTLTRENQISCTSEDPRRPNHSDPFRAHAGSHA